MVDTQRTLRNCTHALWKPSNANKASRQTNKVTCQVSDSCTGVPEDRLWQYKFENKPRQRREIDKRAIRFAIQYTR